jgi:hypothetical protein
MSTVKVIETDATYVTEAGIRKFAGDQDAPPGWADKQVEQARRSHLLLTDQQHADALVKRYWKVGDRARYIGPDRTECTDTGKETLRRTGEVGTVTSVVGEKGIAICVYRPDVLDNDAIVELRFRERTPGALTLERIP